MPNPKRVSEIPYATEVEQGQTYFWCACGESENQPFCDGSHQGSEFAPVKYQATETGKVFFCGCKSTGKQPLCDGSHNS